MDQKTNTIYLHTYKYQHGGHYPLNGQSKQVGFPKEWLLEAIKPQSLEEFLDSYTYDDVEWLTDMKKRTSA